MGKTVSQEYSAGVSDGTFGKKANLIACASVMFVAAVIYSITLCAGAFPGFSASQMAKYIGLEPMVVPGHQVWGAIVGFIGGWGIGGAALRLNIFSMIMAVLSTGMIYHLASSFVYYNLDQSRVSRGIMARAPLFAGIASAVAFAFSVPVWMTATRLHYQIFDLFFLLCLVLILMSYFKSGKTYILMVFSLLFGVAVAENLLILLAGPLFLFALFYYWYQLNSIKMPRVFAMLVLFLVGLGVYLVSAKAFLASDGAALAGQKGVWSVVFEMFSEQVRLVKLAKPTQSWLLIVLFVVVPWLAMFAISRRALNESREWSILFFHVAASVCSIVVLVNTAMVSPWSIYREQTGGAILPVALYAMSALVAGYSIAYWYVFISNRASLDARARSSAEVIVGTGLGYAFSWILAVVIAFTAVINGFEANGHRGDFADDCARKIIENLDGRRWIVTDGIFNNHISLQAAKLGVEVNLIPLQNGDVFSIEMNDRKESEVYTKRIENFIDTDKDFASFDKVEMKNALKLGVMNFLQVWMQKDPSLVERLAVINAPDIFIGANCTVVPNFLCFFGVKDMPDPEHPENNKAFDRYVGPEKLAEYKAFWNKYVKELAGDKDKYDPIAIYRIAVLRQIGFVANNMGYLFEDLGRDEEAYLAYSSVRKIDPENASSLLNLAGLLNRKKGDNFHSDEIAKVEKDINDFIKHLKQKIHVWALARTFGYVRDPVAFAQLGYSWAMSGRPGIAVAGLERAVQLSTTESSRLNAKSAMAEMLLVQNESDKSEAIYNEILTIDPEAEQDEVQKARIRLLRQDALVKKSRIEARRGMLDKAREWLEEAKKSGVDNEKYAFESAAIDLAAGKADSARITLNELTDIDPLNLRYWSLLAVTEITMGDTDDVSKRILPKMETIAGTPDNYIIQLTRGQLYASLGKEYYKDARAAYERAAYLNQSVSVQLLEHVLRLDFLLNDKENAEVHAGMIIRQHRQNSFANYIMGSIMLERGRRAEAEDYLRRSVSESKTPEALNDLAELLLQTGNYEEAEKQIRAAIDIAPDLYVVYDTLGGILSATSRLDEAEQSYIKALELYGEDIRVHLNLAILYEKKGNLAKVRELVAKIRPRRGELPATDQKQLDELLKKISSGK